MFRHKIQVPIRSQLEMTRIRNRSDYYEDKTFVFFTYTFVMLFQMHYLHSCFLKTRVLSFILGTYKPDVDP